MEKMRRSNSPLILATAAVIREDYEKGTRTVEYTEVYRTRVYRRVADALKWFMRSDYKCVMVVQAEGYKDAHTMRGAFWNAEAKLIQPQGCYVYAEMRGGRLFLKKAGK